MEVTDQTKDVAGREIHRLVRLYPPPDFVKAASSDRIIGDVATLPVHVFGDPRRRMFPTHTKEATWVSTAFLYDQKANIKPEDFQMIAERLEKVAEFHGIAQECRELRDKISSDVRNEQERLPDDMFALVFTAGAEKNRHLPLRNAKEVQAAAQYLEKFRDEFTLLDRQTIANKILTKAAEYGAHLAGLDVFLEKQAGRGVCAAAEAAAMVRQRAILARNRPELSAQIEKVAQTIEADAANFRNPASLQKLAALVDGLDRELHVEYGGEIQRPEDVLFCVTEKVASAFQAEHVGLLTGNIYKVADLGRVKVAELRGWLGDDFVESVTVGGAMLDIEKLAEVVPTLPRGDAEIFDRCMAESGIHPFYKEAAAAPVGLSRQQLFELASQRVG